MGIAVLEKRAFVVTRLVAGNNATPAT